jgi:hypothetical protein
MKLIKMALVAALAAIVLPADLLAQETEATDRKIAACYTTNRLRHLIVLAAETAMASLTSQDLKGVCVAACMEHDLIEQAISAAATCESQVKSATMKEWIAKLKGAIVMQRGNLDVRVMCAAPCGAGMCPGNCPSGVPELDTTAAGLAAQFRGNDIGKPSAADVEAAYQAAIPAGALGAARMLPERYKAVLFRCVFDDIEAVKPDYVANRQTPQAVMQQGMTRCADLIRKSAAWQPPADLKEVCTATRRGAIEVQAIVNEYNYVEKSNNRNAVCVGSCMAIEALGRNYPVFLTCQLAGGTDEFRRFGASAAQELPKIVPEMQAAKAKFCEAQTCPRNLPTIDKTAAGLAARLRVMERGDISAYDVKNVFPRAYQIAVDQGTKFTAKTLPAIETATYQCAYNDVQMVAELKKDEKDPKVIAIFSMLWCLQNEVADK